MPIAFTRAVSPRLAECETTQAERVDVDMYVMMDRSVSLAEKVGSTGKIRWAFVREAVQAFQEKRAAHFTGG